MSKTVEVTVVKQPKQLKDYFDFWAADDIRIKETRIGIEGSLECLVQNVASDTKFLDREG